MTTRMGAKTVLHSGTVLHTCATFASGATVKVTVVSERGGNMVKTVTSDELARFK